MPATQAESKIAIAVDHQDILVVIVVLDRLQVLKHTFRAGRRCGFCLKNGVDRSNQLGVLRQYLPIGNTTLPPLNNLPRLQFADRTQLFADMFELVLAFVLVIQITTDAERSKNQ